MQVGTAIGRPFVGVLSDHFGRMTVASLLTASNALLIYAIWIPAQSYGVLIFFALVVGATSGVYWGVCESPFTAPICANLLSDNRTAYCRGSRPERAPICPQLDVVDGVHAGSM
jgi:MFS family permease